jgi:CHASE3 domain sensor protein
LNGATRIKAGFAACFALLLVICYATIQQTKEWEQSARSLARIHQVIERLEDLSLRSMEVEAAARRFVVTPGVADPARCREALSRAVDRTRELQVLIADSGSQRHNLEVVSRLVAQQRKRFCTACVPQRLRLRPPWLTPAPFRRRWLHWTMRAPARTFDPGS